MGFCFGVAAGLVGVRWISPHWTHGNPETVLRRFDRDLKLTSQFRLRLATDNPGSPNVQAGLQKYAVYATYGSTLGTLGCRTCRLPPGKARRFA